MPDAKTVWLYREALAQAGKMTDANRKLIAAEIVRLLVVAVPVPSQLRAVSIAMAPLNSRW